jgi:hypothetical protein
MKKFKEELREAKTQMIKDLEWSIDYHTRKLQEEKNKLAVLLNS